MGMLILEVQVFLMPTMKVTCAIIIVDQRILCVQRSSQMSQPLRWELPGGKVEAGESLEDSLIREIHEELNLNIEIIEELKSNVHKYSNELTIKLIPFICRIKSGTLVLKEHSQAIWLKKRQLLQLDWADADIPIVQDFINI